MAEARSVAILGEEFTQGTRVALSLDEDGLHLRTNITIPPPSEIFRRIKRALVKASRWVAYSFFPFGPAVISGFTAGLVAIVVRSPRDSWLRSGAIADLVWRLSMHMPWLPGVSLPVRVGILAAWTGLAGLLSLAAAQRLALRLLLTDKSFLYNARKPTLWLKTWVVLVRLFTYRRPFLYSFQSSLPSLPVPPLEQTVVKYLESAKMLTSPEQYAELVRLSGDFKQMAGPKLQWYLKLKSLVYANYVTDWWEKYVYLRGRSSIAINSNYYILDSGRYVPTTVREARAGAVLRAMMLYKEKLENEELEPTMIGGSGSEGFVPLCMWQCERIFATSRIPGRECDEIKHWDANVIRHIAVYVNGSFYKLDMYKRDGRLLESWEIEESLNEIVADSRTRHPSEAEASIPALTGENRTHWAEIRETHFCDGTNRRALHTVESALLFVVLSDAKFNSGNDTADWTARGKFMLASDPAQPNFWFDKSVNVVFFADGHCAMNNEHSWADAPTAGHLFEVSMIVAEMREVMYTADGHCIRPADAIVTRSTATTLADRTWTPISWALSRAAEEAIATARSNLHALIEDLDLCVAPFSDYGKEFVKKCNTSPDAYIQMAMQLAYYRDQGHFDATYESSMTRLFLHGRTETVRPVTAESCEFVKKMIDPEAKPEEKLVALQKAAARHVLGYQDAMAGKGIDRHLFALYVVSVGKGIDAPFLKQALSIPWKLSTSQQPQQQTTLWDIKDPKNAIKISPGGGFGPVAEDGYGVSYMVAGEHEFFFHVSSKKSATNTNSARFVEEIFKSLRDMRAVMQLALDDRKAKKDAATLAASVTASTPGAPAAGAGAGVGAGAIATK